MKIYRLVRKQFFPVTRETAWRFFSDPTNLGLITPADMNFKITHRSGGNKMYAGKIIAYRITVLPPVRLSWVTEITHAHAPNYFVDEQKFGPYSMWHHEHHFEEVDGGVEMVDDLTYALPLGWIGRLAHQLFVKRRVKSLFDYRHDVLKEYFLKHSTTSITA